MARKRRNSSRRRSGRRRRRKKTHCSPYRKCKTGPTLKEIKAIAKAMGLKGYSKYTSRNVGSLKRKIVAAGGAVPPITYREPLKHRVTPRERYNLNRYARSKRKKGVFYDLVGAPCDWLPKKSLLDLAKRLGVDVKKYKKTKDNLCRILTKAIRSGNVPVNFDSSDLLDRFRQMHPQDLGSSALRVAVAVPQHAQALTLAHAQCEAERERLNERLQQQVSRIGELRRALGNAGVAIPDV